MRRLCNVEDQQVIYRNEPAFFKGSLEITKSNNKKLIVLFGTIFGLIGFAIAMGLVFYLIETNDNSYSKYDENATRGYSYAAVAIVFGFIAAGVGVAKAVAKKRGVQVGNKEFVSQEIQSVNGGTIVGMNPQEKVIYYIEDDVVNFDGLPIIIDYPANAEDMTNTRIGERVLVVYHSDNQFQLMHATQDSIRLIPEMNPAFPLVYESSFYKHVPHPNAINMELMPRTITEEEKALRIKQNTENQMRQTKKLAMIFMITFTILFGGVAAILYSTGESKDGALSFLFIALFVDVLFLLMIPLAKSGAKRPFKKAVGIKEAIFCSFETGARGYGYGYGSAVMKYVNVYEWENGQFVQKQYPLQYHQKELLNAKYGDIVTITYNEKYTINYFSLKEYTTI